MLDRRILVLGAESLPLQELVQELEEDTYHVAWAKTIDEAKTYFEDDDPIPHLIIDDLQVLDGSTLEFYQSLQGDQQPLAVILSPSFKDLSAEQAEDYGFAALFRKPIDAFKVAKSVSSLIYLKFNGGVMRAPRYWTDLEVIRCDGDMNGSVQNFSRGGFCLTLSTDPGDPGDEGEFEVRESGGEEIIFKVRATLRWSYEVPRFNNQEGQDFIAGYQFEDLSDRAKRSLQTLLLRSQEQMLYPVFRLPEEFEEQVE